MNARTNLTYIVIIMTVMIIGGIATLIFGITQGWHHQNPETDTNKLSYHHIQHIRENIPLDAGQKIHDISPHQDRLLITILNDKAHLDKIVIFSLKNGQKIATITAN